MCYQSRKMGQPAMDVEVPDSASLSQGSELDEKQLQGTKRAGWVQRGVKDVESVAGHMYRMGIMAFLSGPNLNKDKCIKLSLVHDMAECIVGDITPADGIEKEEKYRRELEAMKTITGLMNSEAASEIHSLWEEYEAQKTPEATFVKDLDRFDMILQAFEYEQSQKGPGFLQEFFDSTKGKFQHPAVEEWVRELNRLRLASTETATKHKSDTQSDS